MSDYTTDKLTADVLTSRMPVSDAFERAQAVVSRHGVHHGFGLSWGSGSQLLNSSTKYLYVTAGKASVAVTRNAEYSAQDPVFVMTDLSTSVLIDLEALSSPILPTNANEYYVALRVDYTASDVNQYTGLVNTPGINAPKLVFWPVSGSEGWVGKTGIVLGKFCRYTKHLEMLADNSLVAPDIACDQIGVDVPSVTKESPAAAILALRLGLATVGYHHLKKRIRLRGLSEAAGVNSSVMPLSGITGAVATSVSAINSWARPVDWTGGNSAVVYGSQGIWKDVTSFELLDSSFADDVQLAFHRTPGHDLVRKQVDLDSTRVIDEATIRGFEDYGMRTMVLDFKGSVFAQDLTLDLVLDFTGQPKDCLFRLFVRNAVVKGDFTVNYGQSLLGLAGGAQGILTFENCVAYGDFNIRPWPQVKGVNADSAVTPSAWYAWMNTVQYYLNSAGNVTFSGFTLGGSPSTGPAIMNQWRRNPAAGASAWTKGPIIPCYLHNAVSGAGEFAMGNPWLVEGAEGGVRFRNCALPQSDLLGEAMQALSVATNSIRVSLLGCAWVNTRPAGSSSYWNMIDLPSLRMAADDILLLTGMQSGLYKTMKLYALSADATISTSGSLSATLDAFCRDLVTVRDVLVGRDVTAVRNLTAGGVVDVGPSHKLKATTIMTSLESASGSYLGVKDNDLVSSQSFSPGAGVTERELSRKLIHVSGTNASAGIKIATLALPTNKFVGLLAHLRLGSGGFHLMGTIRWSSGATSRTGLIFADEANPPGAYAHNGFATDASLAGTTCLYLDVTNGNLYFLAGADAFDLVVEVRTLLY